MSIQEPPQPISEDDAREVLNRWGAGGYFRLRNFGDKIFVRNISATSSYTAGLRTHYEERVIRQVRRPFLGGAVDDHGRSPGVWDISVRTPREFEERREVMPVPHTERVQTCPNCAGQGQTVCGLCQGSGQMPCLFCGGTGFVERAEMVPGGGDQGAPMMRTVRTRCSCANGRVRCRSCGGNGRVTCATCSGSGQVVTLDQLTVRFQSLVKGEVLDWTPVPDNLIGKLTGDVLIDEKTPHIESAPPVSPEVDSHVAALLQASHDLDEDHARILLQHLHVERIPVFQIDYTYAGRDRQCWICGGERFVYAPHAPWPRGRLAACITGAAMAVVAAGLALWYFWPRLVG
jgi:hypothetical protein